MESLGNWERSCYCGEPRPAQVGQEVTVMGWVHGRRDHGGVTFIDLRDRSGIVQVVCNPQVSPAAHAAAKDIRLEYVLAVRGVLAQRSPETVNPNLPTGAVEISASELRVLNASRTTPFLVDDTTGPSENARLRYRYLDLRRPQMYENLRLRHRLAKTVRDYLDSQGFLEIETPFLTRSTPEGARDYLVPSRVNPGMFYALPQSPQLFKQLLMVGGMDKYFQIVRCFRDEDLRADRQPEFTQIDIEMSFVRPEDIFRLTEGMMVRLCREIKGEELTPTFPRLAYAEAMARFGNDKPDIRFGLELRELTGLFRETEVQVFTDAIAKGGVIRGIVVPNATLSRKELDDLNPLAVSFGAKGLAWVRVTATGWQSPLAKFVSDEKKAEITAALGLKEGDLVLMVADREKTVCDVLSRLRLYLGDKLGLIAKDELRFLWVTDFPLLEYDGEAKRYMAMHHPFTSPREDDLPLLEADPGRVRALAYDLVLNGVELGGGSIRNHRLGVQQRVFAQLGIGETEAQEKFGFLLEALSYGAPPHGGIAFGFDRLVMLFAGAESLREVIAFPKTAKAVCLLTQAPSPVDPKQLRELSIKLDL
ncbi:MAG TPA: aspartate--tRNA ligase [Candidatus Binatia bacterium]|nr:aspartate--tRNA ligase [Candidatus Binatia bacterium]